MKNILHKYGIDEAKTIVEPLTTGLINRTWKISLGDNQYILQRINDNVFKRPYQIAENIRMVDEYLKEHNPSYLFPSPVKTIKGEDVVYDETEGWFRLFPFIKGSHTIQVVTSPGQAFEAAMQFGKFTRLLSGFDASKLHKTIPDFHNLGLRFHQFENAIENGNSSRIKQSNELIKEIKSRHHIVSSFEKIENNHLIKQRVTHHDTKISNVLFDDCEKGICIIDLDTLMPGYFISDLGDMMRTYLSPAGEEEKDFSKIEIREDFFRAIIAGYAGTMGHELNKDEQDLIFYSGLFLTYMQAMRFLTDHLNNDIYYGAAYEDHNFVRAGNQIQLLKKMEEKREVLEKIISEEMKNEKRSFFA
jgi:Ser/Thr protein kinase RdoA (MazF antagonist)